MQRGRGAYLYFSDWNELDLDGERGALLLGRADPDVVRAILARVEAGCDEGEAARSLSASLVRSLEEDLGYDRDARGMLAFPSVEHALGHVVAARAEGVVLAVGRQSHGPFCEPSANGEPNSRGILQASLPAAACEHLDRLRDRTSLVLVAPSPFVPEASYRELLDRCARADVPVVSNEWRTGYRAQPGPRLRHPHVGAYLFGTGIADGHPLAVVLPIRSVFAAERVPSPEYMNSIALAAAVATVRALCSRDGYERLTASCTELVGGLTRVFQRYDVPFAARAGNGAVALLGARHDLKRLSVLGRAKGIRLSPGECQWPSHAYSHGVVVDACTRFALTCREMSQVLGYTGALSDTAEQLALWRAVVGHPFHGPWRDAQRLLSASGVYRKHDSWSDGRGHDGG